MERQRRPQALAGVLAALLWALATAPLWAQWMPRWVDFWSQNTTLDGQPVPAGAVVRTYDPTGVLAGAFTVTTPGWYGLMPVYGDDPQSPEDEGAEEGDVLPGKIIIDSRIYSLPATLI